MNTPTTYDQLPHRQRQIAVLVGEGMSLRAIGERLGISEHTVDTHVRRIAMRYCPPEPHLSAKQRVFTWVRLTQFERQQKAGAA